MDYDGTFTEERAHNSYLTLLNEYNEISPTLEQFKTRLKQLSKPLPIPMTSTRNGKRYNKLLEGTQHTYQR